MTTTALEFAQAVRAVGQIARREGLKIPGYRGIRGDGQTPPGAIQVQVTPGPTPEDRYQRGLEEGFLMGRRRR